MAVVNNLLKFIKGHNQVFVASERFLRICLNGNDRLFVGAFLVPRTGGLTPINDKFIALIADKLQLQLKSSEVANF